MTEEALRIELEKVLANLNSSGFGAVDPVISKKLDYLSASADELGMKEGSHLINNLIMVINAIKEGKSKPESLKLRLIALEFYLMKFSGPGITIDL
ncbi:MAG: hypothetical protein FWF22_01120 [Treponema sp.]|nr:hypothetical protein [Treponema sp.]